MNLMLLGPATKEMVELVSEVANFGVTVVLVGLVLGACGTWLAQLPEGSYHCFEGMPRGQRHQKKVKKLRTEPLVKVYNVLMAIGWRDEANVISLGAETLQSASSLGRWGQDFSRTQ